MSPAAGVHIPLLPERKVGVKPASVSGAVFNVATSIIGAGIMSIPATLKVLGVIPAFGMILIIALLAELSVDFLMRFTHSGETTTYAGVMKEAFGPVGAVAAQICVMITNFGCLTMYLIIIGTYAFRLLPFFVSSKFSFCEATKSLLSSGWAVGAFYFEKLSARLDDIFVSQSTKYYALNMELYLIVSNCS